MLRLLLLALLLLGAGRPAFAAPEPVLTAVDRILAEARSAAAGPDCDRYPDTLVRILCSGRIRIGVRSNYPGFGLSQSAAMGEARSGYEIDLAREIASRLGVALTLVTVSPASRIAVLNEGRLDLVLATMGHTALRDTQVRFIRPHYYRSTTIVVGDRRLPGVDWDAVNGRTVCVPLGNADSAALSLGGARLLVFDNPQQMLDALKQDICVMAMHDDTFFAQSFADPNFTLRFEPKLQISSLPWGMATARDDKLALLLDALSIAWHADGRFIDAARRHRIGLDFLEVQRLTWREPPCVLADGRARPDCLEPPADTTLPPTSFAPQVEAFEDWLKAKFGLDVNLPMLKTVTAWRFFLGGIGFSLVLVAGALVSTLGFALLFGAMLCTGPLPARLATRALTTVLQCSPLVLLMFFAYAVASTLMPYSSGLALVLAILMIGIYNGSYASHAIAENHAALRVRSPAVRPPFLRAVRGASVQIMSFLVNATKGSAIASMIGVPELLNALTDITSFTSERIMTYSVLLAFYVLLVMLVVWLTGVMQRRLAAAEARA